MTSLNEYTHECAVLLASNEREQSYASNQLSNWQSSRLNTILYQQKVSSKRFKKQERWNVQWLWQICE